MPGFSPACFFSLWLSASVGKTFDSDIKTKYTVTNLFCRQALILRVVGNAFLSWAPRWKILRRVGGRFAGVLALTIISTRTFANFKPSNGAKTLSYRSDNKEGLPARYNEPGDYKPA